MIHDETCARTRSLTPTRTERERERERARTRESSARVREKENLAVPTNMDGILAEMALCRAVATIENQPIWGPSARGCKRVCVREETN
jgi:hypothetical protein